MKNKITYALIALALLLTFNAKAIPHKRTVEIKLAMLCEEFPDKDCKKLQEYCRESLEKGFECYITE